MTRKKFEREVMNWVVLLKNAEKRCESINIESYWPRRAIREGRVNNDTGSIFWI